MILLLIIRLIVSEDMSSRFHQIYHLIDIPNCSQCFKVRYFLLFVISNYQGSHKYFTQRLYRSRLKNFRELQNSFLFLYFFSFYVLLCHIFFTISKYFAASIYKLFRIMNLLKIRVSKRI